MNIVQRLVKIADRVDAKGIHSAAEDIDQLISTLQETEPIVDPTIELEASVRAQLNPLGNLIKVANELDNRGLTVLADKMDKMIELEALKTQSAIDAILSIYKRKHKVASCKKTAEDEESWEYEEDPTEVADWWKHPEPKGRTYSIVTLNAYRGDGSDSLGISSSGVYNLDEWSGPPFWKNMPIDLDDGLERLYQFIDIDNVDEIVGSDVEDDGRYYTVTAGQVTDSFLKHLGKGQFYLWSDDPTVLSLTFIPQELASPIKHERIEEQMPGEVPTTEDLEKWYKEGKGKRFCKQADVRKDNTEIRCPFGLPIPEGCKNVGSLVAEMDENKSEENKEIYESYKSGQPCPFAAEILENQNGVNCSYGTPMAGVQMPELYHGSPIYPKMFEGFNTVNLDRSYQPTDFSNYSIYGGLRGFCKKS